MVSVADTTISVNYILLSINIAALQFGESDLFIIEGSTPRSIAVERLDVSYPLEVKVYSSTIDEYKQNHIQMGCTLTLDEIGIRESTVDPAECKQ